LAIVTLGADGCIAQWRGEAATRFPAPAVRAVDATGAGDTFTGVFGAEWQATGNDTQAIRLALSAASASVARHGALASIPSRGEVDSMRRIVS
jgi:sugar/nucleoside kinase (ribokinase family)